MAKNPHDDLQPASSRLVKITTPTGVETLMEVHSEFNLVTTMRWGELRITQHGVRMMFEIGSPVQGV